MRCFLWVSQCASRGSRVATSTDIKYFFSPPSLSLLQALSSILDKELWKRLPATLPSLADALAARGGVGGSSSSIGDSYGGGGCGGGGGGGESMAEFERFVVQGNPWRKQQSPRGGKGSRQRAALSQRQHQLGFGGSAAGAANGGDGGAQQQQQQRWRPEVDEYGVPRSAASTPTAAGGGGDGDSLCGSSQAEAVGAGSELDAEAEAEEESEDVFGEWDRPALCCAVPSHGCIHSRVVRRRPLCIAPAC